MNHPNDFVQSYAFQPCPTPQGIYTSPARPQQSKTTSVMYIFQKVSPWLAVSALLLTFITALFAYYNWRDLGLLEMKHDELAVEVVKQHVAREMLISELTELMTEQQKTHEYSLKELEERMKGSLEVAQEKLLSELTDLMTEQQKTHQYSLEEMERRMKASLEERGYDPASYKSIFYSSTGTSLQWQWGLLLPTLLLLLLQHQ